MKRRLFNLAAAVSLLLAVAVGVLWVRSYTLSDQVVWRREDGVRFLRSAQGRVVVRLNIFYGSAAPRPLGNPGERYGLTYARGKAAPAGSDLMRVLLLCFDHNAKARHWARGGFAWSSRRSPRDLIAIAVAPFWSVAAATAALPLAWGGTRLTAYARRRRRAPGVCRRCGYDLRATPQRCPECGLGTCAA
jgi:hypothetical protein